MSVYYFGNPGLRVEIIFRRREDSRKWEIDFEIVEQKK